MLTRTAEHALRAVIRLARAMGTELVQADRIAADLGAPVDYMAKTLGTLAAAGVVDSRRGPGGGYRLLRPPHEITIASIVDLFEPEPGIARCLLSGTSCEAVPPCAAHQRWIEVQRAVREPLQTTTIADLLSGSNNPTKTSGYRHSAPGDTHTDDLINLLYLA